MSFVKRGHHWKTLSGAPLSLTRSGRNWKVSTQDDSIETYNKNGRLVSIANSNRQTTRLRYRGGKLDKVTGPFGKTLQLSYQNGKLEKVVGALGTVSYAYTDTRLSGVTKVDGSIMGYQYDGEKLISVKDALGQTIASYTYDSKDRVATSSGQNNTHKTSYDYTSSGVEVTKIANNATDSYTFAVIRGVMKQSSSTNVDGSTTTQSYDENGYPKESVAINGTKSQTIYNDDGLLVKRIESVGLASEKTTVTHWHNQFRKPVLQVEDAIEVGNKATQSTYNRKGLLTKRIEGVIKTLKCTHRHHKSHGHHGKGHDHHGHHHKLKIVLKEKRITRFSYNRKGQLTKTKAPNGAISLSQYDGEGNNTVRENALGQVDKILSFDPTGSALMSEDANGIKAESQYDSAGRIANATSNGLSTKYEYDGAGRLTKLIYPDGTTILNEYDQFGNLAKKIDQEGNVTKGIFDSNGNQLRNQVIDENGNVITSITSVYNNKNELIKNTDASGNTTTYEYDSNGNQIKSTDANGNVTRSVFDAQNRLVKIIDALGGETTNAYDVDGNRTRVTTPNGTTTTFTYDSFNQLTKEVSADRGATTYQYDGSGNQIKITDANGNQKNISYDVLNRKTGENWTDAPNLTIAYTYDSCANGVGKLCSITDKSGKTSFEYDEKARITRKIQNIDDIELTKQYAYNNKDQLISETLPSGAVISYSFFGDKIQSISINGNPYITDVSFNATEQLTGWKWADGTPYVKTYDANGRLATFPLGNKTRNLNYDSLGNISGWADSGTDETKVFTYDALNRLKDYAKNNATNTLQSQVFSYDANGNRRELEDDNVTTLYSILENSNRLRKVGNNSYSYDANGNIINDGEHIYSYDARNRLVNVDGISNYLYNSDNMRVKKTTPAGSVLYGWDNNRIYAEYDDKGDVIQETVYFGLTPVALLKGGNTYRIYTDQISTPRVITDNTGTTLWSWDSKPFGESTPDEDIDNNGTALTFNLRFPGQYYDQETRSHYNFNRDYNPNIGRYMQSDPIGLDGGDNSYSYVNNIPINSIDSSGLAATVTRSGNAFTVQMRINYIGPQKGQGPVYNAGIKSIWGGFNYASGWSLAIDLTRGPVNTINVVNTWYDACATPRAEDAPVSHVLGIGGNSGTWNTRDTYGTCASTRAQLAAHEAGHLMGLIDRYGAGGAYTGWKDNIMGDASKNPSFRNLQELAVFHRL